DQPEERKFSFLVMNHQPQSPQKQGLHHLLNLFPRRIGWSFRDDFKTHFAPDPLRPGDLSVRNDSVCDFDAIAHRHISQRDSDVADCTEVDIDPVPKRSQRHGLYRRVVEFRFLRVLTKCNKGEDRRDQDSHSHLETPILRLCSQASLRQGVYFANLLTTSKGRRQSTVCGYTTTESRGR